MTPAGSRPRRADAARNRQLLIDAARQLIDERGPAVVLDEVARRAGVGNATLYRNFPTRGDLLVAVYARDVDELCKQGNALLQAARQARPSSPGWTASCDTSRQIARWPGRDRGQRAPRRTIRPMARAHGGNGGAVADRGPARRRRDDLTARDILALANAAVLAGTGPDDARRLLDVMRRGFGRKSGA